MEIIKLVKKNRKMSIQKKMHFINGQNIQKLEL